MRTGPQSAAIATHRRDREGAGVPPWRVMEREKQTSSDVAEVRASGGALASVAETFEPRGPGRSDSRPYHVGMIPDGNRRYARKVGISMAAAYLSAADKALETVDWCAEAGVAHLSAFGVSQENIARRPMEDVLALHEALLRFCRGVVGMPGTALHLFGDPARLPATVPGREELIRLRCCSGPQGAPLVVHVGVNYSGQAELTAALDAARARGIEAVAAAPAAFTLSAGVPPVDLVVRTAGQQRLSGFLPFQTAYAELWFTSTLWPELGRAEFLRALDWYARQERHFGE